MENKNKIQILRGAETYNPLTSEFVLLDGQLFYSKKNNQLYIGDGVSELKLLKPITNNDINIINGQAIPTEDEPYKRGSITSASLYDDDKVYEEVELPIASGHESFAWGKKARATGKRSFSFGNGNSSEGNCAFTIGQLNTNKGNGNIVTGNSNKIFKKGESTIIKQDNIIYDLTRTDANMEYSITGGQSNINNSQRSFVIGSDNLINTNDSIVGGQKNKLFYESFSSIVCGNNNIVHGQKSIKNGVEQDSTHIYSNGGNIVVGSGNKVESNQSAIFGQNNILKHVNGTNNDGTTTSEGWSLIVGTNNESNADKTFLLGEGLKSTNWGQTIVGKYDKFETNALFVVGNGTSNNDRKNAFEVKRTGGFDSYGDSHIIGRLNVESEPENENDVVRKKDLEKAINELKQLLNLNNQ